MRTSAQHGIARVLVLTEVIQNTRFWIYAETAAANRLGMHQAGTRAGPPQQLDHAA